MNAEREHSKKLLDEMQKQIETTKKLMQEEIRTMTAQMLSESREHLNTIDKERLDALLKPASRPYRYIQPKCNNGYKRRCNKQS